jgi:hypothetical protein
VGEFSFSEKLVRSVFLKVTIPHRPDRHVISLSFSASKPICSDTTLSTFMQKQGTAPFRMTFGEGHLNRALEQENLQLRAKEDRREVLP